MDSRSTKNDGFERLMTLHKQSGKTINEALALAEGVKERGVHLSFVTLALTVFSAGTAPSAAERQRLIELYEEGLTQLRSGTSLSLKYLDDNQQKVVDDWQKKMRLNMDYVQGELARLSTLYLNAFICELASIL